MTPKKISVTDKSRLSILNKDDTLYEIPLKYLRDECPCADCKGETILFKTIRPAKQNISTPGRYDIGKIEIVGNYAIQIRWKDGHDTGIYTWEYLKTLASDTGENLSHQYEPLIK